MSSSTPIETLPNFNPPEELIMEDYDPMPPIMSQQQPQISFQAAAAQTFFEKHQEDLKFAGIVFFSVIFVHFTSLDRYFSQFIKLDNIPYNEIILRACVVSLVAVIIKKLFTA